MGFADFNSVWGALERLRWVRLPCAPAILYFTPLFSFVYIPSFIDGKCVESTAYIGPSQSPYVISSTGWQVFNGLPACSSLPEHACKKLVSYYSISLIWVQSPPCIELPVINSRRVSCTCHGTNDRNQDRFRAVFLLTGSSSR